MPGALRLQCSCRGECGTRHGYGNTTDQCPQREGGQVRGRRPYVGTLRVVVVRLVDGRCQLCAFAVDQVEASRRAATAEGAMRPGLFER